MPWKVRSVMDERMRFVIRLKDGEAMASLCREFGISRETGYKIFERYQQCRLEALKRGATPRADSGRCSNETSILTSLHKSHAL